MTAMTTLPRPLPSNSPKLRRFRFEAHVARPFADNPTRSRVYLTGRFATQADAEAWAEGSQEQPGDFYTITYYTERDGWRGRFVKSSRVPKEA